MFFFGIIVSMQALRGHRSIYNAVLFDDQPAPAMKVVERKGRSNSLKEKQNELIVCRYWYYIKLKRRTYPDTLELLENEIFLAQLTIIRIIQANDVLLKSFQETKPNEKFFQKKYPYIVWD